MKEKRADLLCQGSGFSISVYFGLSVLYKTVLIHDETLREVFELVCIYASRYESLLHLKLNSNYLLSEFYSQRADLYCQI